MAVLIRSLLALLCACLLGPVAGAQGTVISIGGALSDGNVEIWSRVVAAAGGPGARFVVVSAASENPDASAAANIALLQQHGAVAEHLRVGPRIAGQDVAAAVRDPRWIELVRGARGVFFTGGDQSLIVQTLRPGGADSPLMLSIRELFDRGGVVAGSSAGAAVMSEPMFIDGAPIDVLKGRAGVVHGAGLGFVKPGVIVDQHFLKRGRIGRLVPLLVREGLPLGLGVEEDSAAVIRGDQVEAIGSRGVMFVDASGAVTDASRSAFNVRGVKLSYLDSGDRLDLATRRVTPSARKTRHLADSNPAWRPYFRGEHLFTEILGDFTIVSAMARLVDSRSTEVRGLAFDPLAVDALGFEWRLYRAADTSAWSVGDRYTIAGVLLDVQPVRMARPLFTPMN